MGLKIFISYSQTDATPEAKFVVPYLGSIIDNSEVFYDLLLKRGSDWKKRISEKLDACDVFVVILTNSGIRSSAVKKEVLRAKKLNKIIIPCKDDLLPKSWEELPWGISKRNGIEYNGETDLGKKLVSGITPIEETKTREEKEEYHKYLDNTFGPFEIELMSFSASEILQNFGLAYEEGFRNWRINYLNKKIREEDITEENSEEEEDNGK